MYEKPVIEIVKFSEKDILTTSGNPTPDDGEIDWD